MSVVIKKNVFMQLAYLHFLFYLFQEMSLKVISLTKAVCMLKWADFRAYRNS